MVKKIVVTLLCLFLLFPTVTLPHHGPGMTTNGDTVAVRRLIDSANYYTYSHAVKSIAFGQQALKLAERIRDARGEAEALISLTKVSYIKGEYNSSLQYSFRLAKLSRQLNYGRGVAFALNNRGLIYLSQDNYKAALIEFKAALATNKASNILKPQASNYFNIALCNLGFNELELAEQALAQSITICNQTNDQTVLVMSINRLGDIAFKRRQYAKSLGYFQKAIVSNTSLNDWEFAYSYTGMAISLFETKAFRQAIQQARKGLNYAKKLGAAWDIERASAILYKASSAVGDYENAYVYLQLNKNYSDSLYSEKKEKEINGLLLKQKHIENEELQHSLQIKQQKNQLNQLVLAIVGVIVVFMLIILVLISRKNKEVKALNRALTLNHANIVAQKNQIEMQNTELATLNHSKDQLFSVIGHDLRSPIVSIIQTVDLIRSRELTAAETREVMNNFFEKLTATATMLDNLLLWVNQQKHSVSTDKTLFPIGPLINQLLLVLSFQAKEKNIRIDHQEVDGLTVYADINHVRIIAQNLISNAIKFTPLGGSVFISYFSRENKTGIVIKDTGVGIVPEKQEQLFKVMGKAISSFGTANEKGIGIGLMLVKKYVDENQAQLLVNSGSEGTAFTVIFEES